MKILKDSSSMNFQALIGMIEDEWYNSKTRGTLGVEGTFPCESGATYKTVFVVTAYIDGVPETETVDYIKVCP